MRSAVQVVKRSILVVLPVLAFECCSSTDSAPPTGGLAGGVTSGGGATSGHGGASGTGGAASTSVAVGGGGGGSVDAHPIVISTTTRTPRATTWSINYWTWSPTYGDAVTGTESLIAPLKTSILRMGGYNNDANTPDPFDDAVLDQSVAYAKAIGAEPLIQVPLLADIDGAVPTAATAAAMVTYANVTKKYGVKYFSIGNEPDLYATQGAIGTVAPAIPGYTPADYCTTARAYVTQMKTADPSIQIVGPDLAWKYTVNSDWLTPILTGCGDLFDIVSIHRYPFASAQASLVNAATDATMFHAVVKSVRGLMQAAGYGDKPLALTEMNVAYDETASGNTQAAVPGTVPAALWLADALGSAMQEKLWTSAVWDISDSWSLGLLGPAPAHTPHPPYYAYALYADHFGPTLIDVTSEPTGVRSYATRNQADDGTQVIAINWNTSVEVVSFQVTGLPKAPTAPAYALPPLSMTAVEIPDAAAATAWTYSEVQHQAAGGPEVLPPTTNVTLPDGGLGGSGGGGPAMVCPAITLPGAAITSMGKINGTALSFGSGNGLWGSFTFSAPAQSMPTAALTADGKGFQVTSSFVPASSHSEDYEGVGLYFSNTNCVDASAYTGLQFDFSGDLGGCILAVGVQSSQDVRTADDPGRGQCTGSSTQCYGPRAPVVPGTQTTIKVPFSDFGAGMPMATLDKTSLISLVWQVTVPLSSVGTGGASGSGGASSSVTASGAGGSGGSGAGGAGGAGGSGKGTGGSGGAGGGCSANFTVTNASFY